MPMANAACPDPDQEHDDDDDFVMDVVEAMANHLCDLSTRIKLGSQRLEYWHYHCTENLIVALPTLYHVVPWKTVQSVGHFSVWNIVHSVVQPLFFFKFLRQQKGSMNRSAFQNHHSLGHGRKIFVRTGDTVQWRQVLLDEHPVSFAIVGLVEALGWWDYKGLPLRELNVVDQAGNELPFLSFIADYLSVLNEIVAETPSLPYILPIAKALAKNRRSCKPKGSTSLLFGPLVDSNRRCGRASCRKTAEEAGLEDLLRCRGCDGLEQYCCEEHQREDWKKPHSKFCKICWPAPANA